MFDPLIICELLCQVYTVFYLFSAKCIKIKKMPPIDIDVSIEPSPPVAASHSFLLHFVVVHLELHICYLILALCN